MPTAANESATDEAGPILDPVRSVVVQVGDLDAARPFYEEGLGLECVDTVEDVPAGWDLAENAARGARVAASEAQVGMVDLIEAEGAAGPPCRDPERPWDYGLLTLNVRVRDLDRALSHLRAYGAEPVSEPLAYEAGGTAFREVMVLAPGGVRFTLLQIGPAETEGAPIEGGIATVGVVVSDFDRVCALFGEGFGWSERVSFDHTGAPFDRLLGAPEGTHLRMAVFAAGTHADGKLEPLRLDPPDDTPRSPPGGNDQTATGLRGITLRSSNLAGVATQCRRFEVPAQGPTTIQHPFEGSRTALTITLPGGGRIECLST